MEDTVSMISIKDSAQGMDFILPIIIYILL
jgi:hypothetical protein